MNNSQQQSNFNIDQSLVQLKNSDQLLQSILTGHAGKFEQFLTHIGLSK